MLQLIIGSFTGIGVFFILSDVLRIPLLSTSKAIRSLSERQKKASSIEMILNDIAVWLSKFIKLNEYKRMQLVSDLQTANMNITPELHIANAIIKAALVGLLIIPAFFIFPLIIIIVAALVIMVFLKEYGSIQSRILSKRNAINYELPRFVFTVGKTLQHNRDVLKILEDYRSNASPELKHELDITVADMRSGNYESALTRLEARVGSTMLSDVVRGLISLIRGDNTDFYWAALSIKFGEIGRQTLKKQAQNIPGKVKVLSMILMFCFMFTYLIIIIMQIMSSIGAMFG